MKVVLFLPWEKPPLQPLVSPLIVFWSVNYAYLVYKLLHFGSVRAHKRCFYFCFFSYICWSVNCMIWVSKFNIFFLTCRETETKSIFEGFNVALYRKFISDPPILFLLFYIWSVNCSRDFFSHFVSQ